MLNKVMLIGNVGQDPVIRKTDGKTTIQLSIATSEKWVDKITSEKKEKTEWHRVIIYNQNIAQITEKYVTKGSKLFIEGSLATRKWVDKAGVERNVTEIIIGIDGKLSMLDSKSSITSTYGITTKPVIETPVKKSAAQAVADFLDDEIPF